MKKISSNKGFTLVELIIVIAILAIIMLIAIPNFSGIQQRMQVRADKSTAAQIGKAVRIWYTEYNSDPAFKAAVTNGLPVAGDAMKELSTIDKLEGYVDKTLKPTSLRKNDGTEDNTQKYWVGLVGAGTSEKVVVAIANAAPTTPGHTNGATNLTAKTDVLYDGVENVEPTSGTEDEKKLAVFKKALAYMEP